MWAISVDCFPVCCWSSPHWSLWSSSLAPHGVVHESNHGHRTSSTVIKDCTLLRGLTFKYRSREGNCHFNTICRQLSWFWQNQITMHAFRKLLSIYVFIYFPFGFEGRMWDLIVSVPDRCLLFDFVYWWHDRTTIIHNSLTEWLRFNPYLSILVNWMSPFPILGESGALFYFYF